MNPTGSRFTNRPSFAKRFRERVLMNNLWNIPVFLLLLPFALMALVVIRLLRPWVVIRIDTFISHRIGHFAANTDRYLCERKAGLSPPSLDFFYYSWPISNVQLKKMWDRVLPVIHFSPIGALIQTLNRLIPGYQTHRIPVSDSGADRDLNDVIASSPPNIQFSAEEEQYGEQEIAKIGIPQGAPFVCFFVRDSAYLNHEFPGENWHYHDYRNSNIQNCLLMAEELAGRGYTMVRMGAKVKEPLRVEHPMIIDYAWKHRTDFLDIYLSAKCSFFVGGGSGIDALPMLFRRPFIGVNIIPVEYVSSWGAVLLSIPKKLWLRKEQRFLTFREIIESGIGRIDNTEGYQSLGIDVIENTPEEIRDVVIEAEERLKGTWQPTPGDEELQSRFWSLFQSSDLHGKIGSRIGAQFLRQNRLLLD